MRCEQRRRGGLKGVGEEEVQTIRHTEFELFMVECTFQMHINTHFLPELKTSVVKQEQAKRAIQDFKLSSITRSQAMTFSLL